MPDDPEPTVQVSSRIRQSVYDDFVVLFPWHGATSGIIEQLITELVKQAKSQPTMTEQIRSSVFSFLEERKRK